jgi:DNA-binding TFAR19-related protein (PDSD5 family)
MTIAGAIMKTLAISFVGIPVVAFVLYLVLIRQQSATERLQRRRVTQLQRSTAGVSSTNLSEVVAPKQNTEHWIPLTERELTGVTILPKGSAAARGEWQPNSIPVPTYVSAPKAIVPKRVLDLTTPGQWSEEQERLEREALAAAAPSRDEIFDQQLADEAVARLKENRAANE